MKIFKGQRRDVLNYEYDAKLINKHEPIVTHLLFDCLICIKS